MGVVPSAVLLAPSINVASGAVASVLAKECLFFILMRDKPFYIQINF